MLYSAYVIRISVACVYISPPLERSLLSLASLVQAWLSAAVQSSVQLGPGLATHGTVSCRAEMQGESQSMSRTKSVLVCKASRLYIVEANTRLASSLSASEGHKKHTAMTSAPFTNFCYVRH